jgi:hypothetical protein
MVRALLRVTGSWGSENSDALAFGVAAQAAPQIPAGSFGGCQENHSRNPFGQKQKDRRSKAGAVGPTVALAAFLSRPQAVAQIGACKKYGEMDSPCQLKP